MFKGIAYRSVSLKHVFLFFHLSFLLPGEVMEKSYSVEWAVTETVRTNFPETWIWDLASVE